MTKKTLEFINTATKKAFDSLPQEIKKQFLTDLNAVQNNTKPFSKFKDISGSVDSGAIELIENGSPAYRLVYCAKYLNSIHVLHAFEKTTEGVDQKEMNTAKGRYKLMMAKVRAENKKLKTLKKLNPKKKQKKKKK